MEEKIVDVLLRRFGHAEGCRLVSLLKKVKSNPRREVLLSLKTELEAFQLEPQLMHKFLSEYHDELYEEEDGCKVWKHYDKPHCTVTDSKGMTLPAVVGPTVKKWMYEGNPHRYEVGSDIANPYTYDKPLPAIEYTNGERKWFFFGQEYSEECLTKRIFHGWIE
jgi:hypothetical protein